MKKTLKGMAVAFSGTFGERSRTQLSQDLRGLGASASNKINTKTDLFIEGHRASGSKLQKARMSGVPIIDMEQLDALLAGASLSEVLGMEEEEVVEIEAFEDVLMKARELLGDEDERRGWDGICELLDHAAEEDVDAILDYVLPHTEAWAKEFEFTAYWGGGAGDLREAPQTWIEQMLTGRDSKKMQIIRVLNLASKKLVGKVAAKLFDVKHLNHLIALVLSNNKLPASFFKQLAESGMWGGLRFLSLSDVPMRKSGWEALASATHLSQLTHLNLRETKLDDEGIDILVEAEHLGSLTHLNLERNSFTSAGLKALAESPLMANLTHLYLGICDGLGVEGYRALFSSPYITQLEVLEIGYTRLGTKGIEALAASTNMTQLRELNIEYNGLSAKSMETLAEAQHLTSLQKLNIGSNEKIGNGGIAALVEAPFASQLKEIECYGCGFGVKGAEAIANSTQLENLERLSCGGKEDVAVVLVKAKNLKGLKYLWAGSFTADSDYAKAVKHARHLSKELREVLKGHIYKS